jgi:uncharacterized protein (DUF433 family)
MQRITISPTVLGGKPSVRGMPIAAANVAAMLKAGMSHEDIIKALPGLEPEDIVACAEWAAGSLDQSIIL